MAKLKAALLFGVGTAVGVLIAPREGSFYRNQILQKAYRWVRLGSRSLARHSRDLANRARGAAVTAKEKFDHERGRTVMPFIDERTLADHVKTSLGRIPELPLQHVNIQCIGRTVELHGFVNSAEDRDRLLHAICGVGGVGAIDANRLRVRSAA